MIKRWLIKKAKSVFYFILFYSGLLHLSLLVFTKIKKKHCAVILFYHQILDNNSGTYLYKNPSVHHTVRDFEKEIDLISRWFKVVSLDELTEHIKGNYSLTEPAIVITFDDGYRDNYTVAYPILRRYDLPATIYLISGLVGTNKRTWPDQVEFALLETAEKRLLFPGLFGNDIIDISSMGEKRKANSRITKALKQVGDKKKKELITELFHVLGLTKDTDNSFKERRMLSWEEVKEMSNNKISFGAHTVSHPILTRISFAEGNREIVESKYIIEETTGCRAKHFAIPNGRVDDFSEDLKKSCIDNGFETIATTEYGYVGDTSDPYFLRRVMPNVPIYFFFGELIKLFLFSNRYEKNGTLYTDVSET